METGRMQTRKRTQSGCWVTMLLLLAFVVGGMIGGILGGALLWWAIEPTQTPPTVVVASEASPNLPTATPLPQPTFTATPVLATRTVADVVERLVPAVVTIVNSHRQPADGPTPDDSVEVQTIGSGIVVDDRGYIVTNAHVINDSYTLQAVLSDGRAFPARLVTVQPGQDLAMLKIDAAGLQALPWGDSANLRLGEPVIAIGSALGDFPNSVTMGIISGLDRALTLENVTLYGLIQTDAAINQGNSGGPLTTLNGSVIGINTFIIREDHQRGYAQGIGFAIPADAVKLLSSAWIVQDQVAIQANALPAQATPIPAARSDEE